MDFDFYGLHFDPVVLAIGQVLVAVVFGVRRWLLGRPASSRFPENERAEWYVRLRFLYAATFGASAATAGVRAGVPWPEVLLRGVLATVLVLAFLLGYHAVVRGLRHGRTYVGASGVAGFDEWTAVSIERRANPRVPDPELQALIDEVRTSEQRRDGELDPDDLDPTVVVSERDLDS